MNNGSFQHVIWINRLDRALVRDVDYVVNLFFKIVFLPVGLVVRNTILYVHFSQDSI